MLEVKPNLLESHVIFLSTYKKNEIWSRRYILDFNLHLLIKQNLIL